MGGEVVYYNHKEQTNRPKAGKEKDKNMKNNRFDAKGVCKCNHIKDGTCKQCSVCDCCEYYVTSERKSSCYDGNIPGCHFWGGQVRNNAAWRKGW